MIPIRLTDSQLRELMQAAGTVPLDLRRAFVERVAAELRGAGRDSATVTGTTKNRPV
jgi:hypothetical protein